MRLLFSSLFRRGLRSVAWLVLAIALSLPAPAAAASTANVVAARGPAATFAWTESVLGNRARMVQFACVGMALAIFILCLGHKQGR